jgi:hypothetical protein
MSQGSGATVSITAGRSKIIYANGAGAGAAVYDFTSALKFTTVAVADGGTGGTTISAARSNLKADRSTMHCTVGGTANALTLTTGVSLAALTVGMKFSFVASASANTGASTAAIDGLTAVPIKTVVGADTPADYIRASKYTKGYFDGTNLVLDRETQYAAPLAGINGEYWKRADGTLECHHQQTATNNVTTAAGGFFIGTAVRTWTFPETFVSQPAIAATYDRTEGWIVADGYSNTEFRYYPALTTSTSGAGNAVDLAAFGRWY